MRKNLFRILLGTCTLTLLAVAGARADNLYGEIRGTVADASGAVIPGATVAVTNEGTGVTKTVTTEANGDFDVVNLLAPADYTITVTAQGFRTYTSNHAHLDLNQVYVANATLEVGTTAQQVTVEANPSQINTTQMQLGAAITGTTIVDLPLNGRNWLQLQQLQPGVVGASDRLGIGTMGTNFATNGAQSQQNSFYVNGLDTGDISLNAAGLIPSPDAIGEFQMITSTINPEFGRNSGAVMNAVIKNGTNLIHGDGFEFYRDRSLDAANSLTNILAPYHQNEFGGTVGGPILLPHVYNGRDKSFFFFSYQGIRNTVPEAFGVPTVFSAAERTGNFADMGSFYTPGANSANPEPANSPCGPGYTGPFGPNPLPVAMGTAAAGTPYCVAFPTGQLPSASLSPLATKLMNQYVPTANGPANAYNFSPEVTRVDDEYITRIDQNFGSRDSIWGYWLWERNPTTSGLPFQGSTLPGFSEVDGFHAQQYAISWNHTFNPTTINEARFGYFRFNDVSVYPQSPINPTTYGFTGINPQNPSVASIPGMFVAGLFNLGFSIYGPQPRLENTYQVIDNFTKIVGNHSLKAGFTNDRFEVYNPFDEFNSGLFLFLGSGTYSSGQPGADFLLGLPDSYTQGNGAVINARSREYYSYFQDQWKVRPNLTLTLGTGWDIDTPYLNLYDKGELVNAFRPGVQSTVFPLAPTGVLWPGDPGINSAGGVTTHYKDFAPRAGFAWSPGASRKWSIHGGFGIYFNRTEEEIALQNLSTPPFSIEASGVGKIGGSPSLAAPYTGWCGGAAPAACSTPNLFPYTPPTGGNVSFAALEPLNINTLSPNFGVPMAENFNLTLERQVTDSMTLTVAYVGSDGHHLEGNYELNPAGSAAGNPVAAANGCTYATLQTVPACAATFRYNPLTTNLGAINYQATDFNSNYNSLQISVNQRFHHGLSFLAAYTWSRNFDYNSTADNQDGFVPPGINPFNFRSMYGPSNNDAPQRFVLSYDYTLPFYQFAHRLRPLTDGWKLVGIVTFQSGNPVEIADTSSPSLTCNPGDFNEDIDVPCWDRPNRTSVPLGIGNPRNYVINGKPDYWFNPAAFASAPAGQLGNSGRNPFYGPGINNFDTSLIKDIHITESKYIELRGETFNTFNHQQWGPPVNTSGLDIAPVADINNSNFGRITSIRSNFIAQLGVKIYF
jgi:hypothetical protein